MAKRMEFILLEDGSSIDYPVRIQGWTDKTKYWPAITYVDQSIGTDLSLVDPNYHLAFMHRNIGHIEQYINSHCSSTQSIIAKKRSYAFYSRHTDMAI